VERDQGTVLTKRLSSEEFLQNLTDSGLFSTEEVRSMVEALPASAGTDAAVMAQHLIGAEKLTPFQAAAVSERRFAELLMGNYEVLDRLGAGGMGTVYKARHRRMKRVVAIKVLPRTAGQSAAFLRRFQREVEAVARLSHPNVVLAHDADEAEAGHFLVMEFVDGRDLAADVEARGPLPIREAVDYVVQGARALDYAHRQGIIHRDIKPANLLRDAGGVIKVADLGLARFTDQYDEVAKETALTQAGTLMGTVDFMSPEQALGLTNIDQRTDIYSLGCSLYYLLVGRPPYEGRTAMAILLQHREGPIPSLCAARTAIPPALDAVFRRMVAKKPEDRFASMSEVVRALEVLSFAPEPQAEHLPGGGGTHAPSPTVAAAPLTADTAATSGPAVARDSLSFEATPPSAPEGFPLKVLLVEPSRTQAGIIRRYLQAQGVQHVAMVASGQDALKAVRSDRPDAIISALHLSDMTGIELAQQVRGESGTAAPGFVLISSEAESSQAGKLSAGGKSLVLQKPFTTERLFEALKMVSGRQPPPAVLSGRDRLRVLIVDDSAAARLHVRSVLAGLGLAQFVEAADGAEAVAVLARQAFDLIVTDYNMPYMDGRGLVGYLKQNPATASVPIIMVTTEDDPAKLDAVRRLGVAAVCDKSFRPEAVRQIVDKLASPS
jgi:serine/threonine protein kinase/DNA-binding response OmpR family regulator